MQDHGIQEKKVVEVVTETGAKKLIDVGNVPLGPKANFEQVIDPELLEKGPPFSIVVKNIIRDASVEDVMEYFKGISLTVILFLLIIYYLLASK